MTIVIVGAGAIGMLMGAYLARGGNEVIFVEINSETVALFVMVFLLTALK